MEDESNHPPEIRDRESTPTTTPPRSDSTPHTDSQIAPAPATGAHHLSITQHIGNLTIGENNRNEHDIETGQLRDNRNEQRSTTSLQDQNTGINGEESIINIDTITPRHIHDDADRNSVINNSQNRSELEDSLTQAVNLRLRTELDNLLPQLLVNVFDEDPTIIEPALTKLDVPTLKHIDDVEESIREAEEIAMTNRNEVEELKKTESRILKERVTKIVQDRITELLRSQAFRTQLRESLITILKDSDTVTNIWKHLIDHDVIQLSMDKVAKEVITIRTDTEIGHIMKNNRDTRDALDNQTKRIDDLYKILLDKNTNTSLHRLGDGLTNQDDDPKQQQNRNDKRAKRNKSKSRYGSDTEESDHRSDSDSATSHSSSSQQDSSDRDSANYDSDRSTSPKRSRSSSRRETKHERKERKRLLRVQKRQERTLKQNPYIPMLDRFSAVTNWESYRLRKRDPVYTLQGARRGRRWEKDMDRYMKIKFNGSDPVSIINFLIRFTNGCNKYEITEGNAARIMTQYLEGTPKDFVESQLSSSSDGLDSQSSALYITIVHELLRRYATDSELRKIDDEIHNMHQKFGQTAIKFLDKLTAKTSRFGTAYKQSEIREIFSRGLDSSIRDNVATRWRDKNDIQEERNRKSKTRISDSERQTQITSLLRDIALYADTLKRDTNSDDRRSDRRSRSHVSQIESEPSSPRARSSSPVTKSSPSSAISNVDTSTNNSHQERSKSSSRSYNGRRPHNRIDKPPPKLPITRFTIPPGCTDITKALEELIYNAHSCRFCLKPKTADGAHESSDCDTLPDDPMRRYEVLCMRLLNIGLFRRGVQEGRYEAIKVPPTSSLYATLNKHQPPKN